MGYSDHTQGTVAAVAAVALGARVIEKHFTYRRDGQTFGDHQLSAEPAEFAEMVKRIREVERLRGRYEKTTQAAEQPIRLVARRSVAVRRAIPQGEEITRDDLTWLRPASGIPPGEERRVIGRRAARDLVGGEILTLDDLSDEPLS